MEMYILSSDFSKKTINMYLKLDICVVCKEVLDFRYVHIYYFVQNKSYEYLNLYIRNLENLRLNPIFWYTISFCICVGR